MKRQIRLSSWLNTKEYIYIYIYFPRRVWIIFISMFKISHKKENIQIARVNSYTDSKSSILVRTKREIKYYYIHIKRLDEKKNKFTCFIEMWFKSYVYKTVRLIFSFLYTQFLYVKMKRKKEHELLRRTKKLLSADTLLMTSYY